MWQLQLIQEHVMMMMIVSDQNFRKGLSNYLKNFSYKNASTGLLAT